jgi:bifunctional non-homologous end joining protein LigD
VTELRASGRKAAVKKTIRQKDMMLLIVHLEGLATVDGQDVRPEPLEKRRKRLSKLLSRSNKTMRDGIQVGEAITGDGAAIFRHACWMDLEGIVSKRIGSRYVSGTGLAEGKNPNFQR